MALDFFSLNLAAFALLTIAGTVGQTFFQQRSKPNGNSDGNNTGHPGHSSAAKALWRAYIVVYALVMGADWLQGPYMYPLYSSTYEFADRTVAALFVFGFSAGGVSAPYVGKWADKYGRKQMCLTFCGTYAASCFAAMIPSLPILLVGRVLGGISTSILFSCFEAWLISSAHAMNLSEAELSSILGRCTFVNGIVAAVSGIFSNALVSYFGTVKAPFMASVICLSLAAAAIRSTWNENYGETATQLATSKATDPESAEPLMNGHAEPLSMGSAVASILRDASLLTLGLTQTLYETAMYLFVFLWVPALQIVSHREEDLPFGIIFSAFMCCMSFGSLVYSTASRSGPKESPVRRHSSLASITCLIAAGALVVSAISEKLRYRFWAFCLFEVTVGMYFPILGTLRGHLIPDESRASFSALFRVPLNVLVTVCLITGAEEHKDMVILASVVMLLTGSVSMILGIRQRIS